MRSKTILLIGRDEDNEDALRAVLAGEGYAFLAARDVGDALETVKNTQLDIVLIDYSLFAHRIESFIEKLSSSSSVRIPVLLLVTLPEMEEAKSCPGIAGFVAKPINTLQLVAHLSLIAHFCETPEAEPSPRPKRRREIPDAIIPEEDREELKGADDMRGKRILLVDDDPDVLDFITDVLETSGFRVTIASDGYEGLLKAREEPPDLILLDIMLPRMDGFQVCRLLKFSEHYRHIPIIMLTARTGQDDQNTAYLVVGADAYITKPFTITHLLDKMSEMLMRTPGTSTNAEEQT